MSADQSKTENRFPLSTEDKARMARLFEEVEARLQEMGRIAARTVDLQASEEYTVKFQSRPRQGPDDGGLPPGGVPLPPRPPTPDIEIICDRDGCYCYDYHEGICIRC